MKVLLTGASGFLGQHVLKQLHTSGIETVAIGRKLPVNCYPDNFIQVDLLGQYDVKDLLHQANATHLLHMAWYAEHNEYWASNLNLRWVEASLRLVEAFCQTDRAQQVVIAGTCAEYDWSYGYCSEDFTPIRPKTLYGTSKDATRRLSSEICLKYGVTYSWGRIFLPYGEGEGTRRLIPSLIDVFQGKKEPFGVNGSAYRDFLHADDLAFGFIKLIQVGAEGVFNICSGDPIKIEDIVKHIAAINQADPKVVLRLSTARPSEPHLLVGNNQKLKELGWTSNSSIFCYLKDMLNE